MFQNFGFIEAKGKAMKENPRYEFDFCAIGEVFIPFARDFICQYALDMKSDYVFMVDDDMIAPSNLFWLLERNKKDICTALAFTRNPNHLPVMYQTIDLWDPVARKHVSKCEFVKNYPRNQLVECDASGFGAALINMNVLKKMPRPWFMGSHGTGEDIHFCLEAKKYGFRVFMDTRVKLGHLSNPIMVTEEYSDEFNKMTPEERDRLYGSFTKYQEVPLAK